MTSSIFTHTHKAQLLQFVSNVIKNTDDNQTTSLSLFVASQISLFIHYDYINYLTVNCKYTCLSYFLKLSFELAEVRKWVKTNVFFFTIEMKCFETGGWLPAACYLTLWPLANSS